MRGGRIWCGGCAHGTLLGEVNVRGMRRRVEIVLQPV